MQMGLNSTDRGSERGRLKNASTLLEHIRLALGNIAEVWSYRSTRSEGGVLRVWFIFPSVQSKHGVKVAATREVSTKDEQVHFYGLKELKRKK